MSAEGDFPMVVTLQGRAKPRGPSETGAFVFQRWLAECRRRGYRVLLAWNETHVIAVPKDRS